jgi:hypothetical protein
MDKRRGKLSNWKEGKDALTALNNRILGIYQNGNEGKKSN